MYEVIKVIISQNAKFIQGKPMDSKEDLFLNPQRINLLILVDMMSGDSKDRRISELFTKGAITETFQSSL